MYLTFYLINIFNYKEREKERDKERESERNETYWKHDPPVSSKMPGKCHMTRGILHEILKTVTTRLRKMALRNLFIFIAMYTSCHAFVMRCNPCVVEDGITDCRLNSSEGCVRITPWPTNVRGILVRDCNVAIQPPETNKFEFAQSFGGYNHGESCNGK